MKKFRPYLAVLLCLPVVFACKKDASHVNACRIIATYDSNFSATGTYINSTRIVYDNDGKIAYTQLKWPTDSATRVFTYDDSAIFVNPTTDRMSSDTIILNDKGLAERIMIKFVGFPSTHVTYSYDPAGVLQSELWGPQFSSSTYQWVNGDCISTTAKDGTVTAYTYYTDKAAADGDPQSFGDWVNYGVVVHRNAHLTRTAKYGSQAITQYSYTFDKAGKITSTTSRVASTVDKLTFEYDCSQ